MIKITAICDESGELSLSVEVGVSRPAINHLWTEYRAGADITPEMVAEAAAAIEAANTITARSGEARMGELERAIECWLAEGCDLPKLSVYADDYTVELDGHQYRPPGW